MKAGQFRLWHCRITCSSSILQLLKGILQQSEKSSLQHHVPSALFAIHKIHCEGKSWMSIYQDSITWSGLLSEALSGWQCSQRDLLHAIQTWHNSSRQDKAWPATTKPSRSTEQKQQIPRPPAGTDSDMQQSSDSSLKSSELGGPQTKHFTTCEQRLIMSVLTNLQILLGLPSQTPGNPVL